MTDGEVWTADSRPASPFARTLIAERVQFLTRLPFFISATLRNTVSLFYLFIFMTGNVIETTREIDDSALRSILALSDWKGCKFDG